MNKVILLFQVNRFIEKETENFYSRTSYGAENGLFYQEIERKLNMDDCVKTQRFGKNMNWFKWTWVEHRLRLTILSAYMPR